MAGSVVARRRWPPLVVALRPAAAWPIAAAVRCSLWLRRAGDRALGQPAADAMPAACRSPTADARALRLIARRTWRFFETFVTPADNMLPPDNFQEDPDAGRRPSHLADQYRPVSAVDRRARAISAGSARSRRSSGSRRRLATMRRLRALPRPFLQLVRHARSAPARSALRLVGRQRQSRRPSDRARQRLRGMARARRADACAARTRRRRCARARCAKRSAALRDGGARRPSRWRQLDEPIAHRSQRHRRRSTATRSPKRLAALASRPRPSSISRSALAGERGDDAERRHRSSGSRRCARAIDEPRARPGADRRDAQLDGAPAGASSRAARAMALAMEFGFLLDRERQLLSIGYSCRRRRARPELLRPARLRGAAGELRRHRQGRRPGAALVPARPRRHAGRRRRGADLLVGLDVRVSDAVAGHARAGGSLLEQTNRLVVRRQIDYGAALGVPWGISESAYNARDLELTYQYSNFGVPGLGLKRGLGENVVIAPYATALAAMVDPRGRARELRAAGARSARAAATASTRRSTSRRARLPEGAERRDRARLHGASSGHDASSRSPTRCSTA